MTARDANVLLGPLDIVMPPELDDCLIDNETEAARRFEAYLDSQVTLSCSDEGAPAEMARYLDVLRRAAASCDPAGRAVQVTVSKWAATCEGAYCVLDLWPDGSSMAGICGCAFVEDSIAACRPAPEGWQRLIAMAWKWRDGDLPLWCRSWPAETLMFDVAQATLLGLFAAFGIVESTAVYLEATLDVAGQQHSVDLRGRVARLAGLGERPPVKVPAWTEVGRLARANGLFERLSRAGPLGPDRSFLH